MKLKILELLEPYRSLQPFYQEFPTSKRNPHRGQEIDPICLVGLNGCGKSNLLELVADIFYYLDKYFLEEFYYEGKDKPYMPYASNKGQKEIYFRIEYTINVKGVKYWVQVKRENDGKKDPKPQFTLRNEAKEYKPYEGEDKDFRQFMPKVIAYTSGLNEMLSIPFMELQDYYAREVTFQVTDEKGMKSNKIPSPNMMLMDYESNALVLIANYLLNDADKIKIFRDTLRIEQLDSFRIVIQLNKRHGGKEVFLTDELEKYVEQLKECATTWQINSTSKGDEYTLDYWVCDATKAAFRKHFETPQGLFNALNKLKLLNTYSIQPKYRKELKKKRENGIPIKFPTIATLDKIFRIEQVELILNTPKVRTQYMNISDGEHQFIHIVGGVLLFDEENSKQDILYLFDEPETHFNPQWRSRLFRLMTEKMDNFDIEMITTTHSPFILSDCRGYNVFVFKRNKEDNSRVEFSRAEWETYGSSFSFILQNFFNFEHEISKKSYKDLQDLGKLGKEDLEKMVEQIRLFGDSIEKMYVLKHINDLKKENAQ